MAGSSEACCPQCGLSFEVSSQTRGLVECRDCNTPFIVYFSASDAAPAAADDEVDEGDEPAAEVSTPELVTTPEPTLDDDVWKERVERLRADEPKRLHTYTREIELTETLDDIFKVIRRIARTELAVFPNSEHASVKD